jgi:flagellar hook-basal body complex protein FliE
MNIPSLKPLSAIQPLAAAVKTQPQSAVNQLGETFDKALTSLSDKQNSSDTLIKKLAAGENVDLHQVMIASEEASISMQVALAMRDKLVQAYQETMRMSV